MTDRTLSVLVAFERSGNTRRAFAALGHDAHSCDLEPADDGESAHHYQCDVRRALYARRWDIVIMHPVCTALAVSGNHVYAAGKPRHAERLESAAYVQTLWDDATTVCRHVALENPVSVIPTLTLLPKPVRTQPYEHGHDASKATCLFLHNLPPLAVDPAKRVPGRLVNGVERWANQTDSGQNRLGPSPDRARRRSETYAGISAAMARDWSAHVLSHA